MHTLHQLAAGKLIKGLAEGRQLVFMKEHQAHDSVLGFTSLLGGSRIFFCLKPRLIRLIFRILQVPLQAVFFKEYSR